MSDGARECVVDMDGHLAEQAAREKDRRLRTRSVLMAIELVSILLITCLVAYQTMLAQNNTQDLMSALLHTRPWRVLHSYTKGDHVMHNGVVYCAKQYVQGMEPGTLERVWSKVIEFDQSLFTTIVIDAEWMKEQREVWNEESQKHSNTNAQAPSSGLSATCLSRERFVECMSESFTSCKEV